MKVFLFKLMLLCRGRLLGKLSLPKHVSVFSTQKVNSMWLIPHPVKLSGWKNWHWASFINRSQSRVLPKRLHRSSWTYSRVSLSSSLLLWVYCSPVKLHSTIFGTARVATAAKLHKSSSAQTAWKEWSRSCKSEGEVILTRFTASKNVQ